MPWALIFIGVVFLVVSLAVLVFSFGRHYEREQWERRITTFAAYLEKTTVPLKIEKDIYHTVAGVLRVFVKKRV